MRTLFTLAAVAAAALAFVTSLASPAVAGAMGTGLVVVAVVSALLAIAWQPAGDHEITRAGKAREGRDG